LKEVAKRLMGIKGYGVSPNWQILIAILCQYCQEDRFEEEKTKLEDIDK